MRIHLLRCLLVTLVIVGASGCRSDDSRSSLPSLAFWKRNPLETTHSSTAPPAATTPTLPSQVAATPGIPNSTTAPAASVATTQSVPAYQNTAAPSYPAATNTATAQQAYPVAPTSPTARATTGENSNSYVAPQQGYYGNSGSYVSGATSTGQSNPVRPASQYGVSPTNSAAVADNYGVGSTGISTASRYDVGATPRYDGSAASRYDIGSSYDSSPKSGHTGDNATPAYGGRYTPPPAAGQATNSPTAVASSPQHGYTPKTDYTPGQTDYQPGRTDYQPGKTGYTPLDVNPYTPPAAPYTSPAGQYASPANPYAMPGKSSTPTESYSNPSSPYLPGSTRPYTPKPPTTPDPLNPAGTSTGYTYPSSGGVLPTNYSQPTGPPRF